MASTSRIAGLLFAIAVAASFLDVATAEDLDCGAYTDVQFRSCTAGPSGCKKPPYLLSIPGSGNSFLRRIIEYLTGIYTGSVYPMKKESIFPGEGTRDGRVSVVKVHALVSHKWDHDLQLSDPVIYLFRNPLDACISEFQRMQNDINGHNYTLPLDFFNEQDVREDMITYCTTMNDKERGLFRDIAVRAKSAKRMRENVLIVKYERLLDNPMVELRRIYTYLKDQNAVGLPSWSDHRALCALQLAEHPAIHRKKEWTNGDFWDLFPDVQCRVWNVVGRYAEGVYYKSPFKDFKRECGPFMDMTPIKWGGEERRNPQKFAANNRVV